MKTMFFVPDSSFVDFSSRQSILKAKQKGIVKEIKNLNSLKGKGFCYCMRCAPELHIKEPKCMDSSHEMNTRPLLGQEITERFIGFQEPVVHYLSTINPTSRAISEIIYPEVSVALDTLDSKHCINRIKEYFCQSLPAGANAEDKKIQIDLEAIKVAEALYYAAIMLHALASEQVEVLGVLEDPKGMQDSREFWVLMMLSFNHFVCVFEEKLKSGYKNVIEDFLDKNLLSICIPDRGLKSIYFKGIKKNLLETDKKETLEIIRSKLDSLRFKESLYSNLIIADTDMLSLKLGTMFERDTRNRDEISGCVDRLTYRYNLHLKQLITRLMSTCLSAVNFIMEDSSPFDVSPISDLVDYFFREPLDKCIDYTSKIIHVKKKEIGISFFNHFLASMEKKQTHDNKEYDNTEETPVMASRSSMSEITGDTPKFIDNDQYAKCFNRILNPRLFNESDQMITWINARNLFEKILRKNSYQELSSILNRNLIKQAIILVQGNLYTVHADEHIGLSHEGVERLCSLYEDLDKELESLSYKAMVNRLYIQREQFEPNVTKEEIFCYLWCRHTSGSSETKPE